MFEKDILEKNRGDEFFKKKNFRFSVKSRKKFMNFEKFVPENLARDNLFIKRKYSHRDDI